MKKNLGKSNCIQLIHDECQSRQWEFKLSLHMRGFKNVAMWSGASQGNTICCRC